MAHVDLIGAPGRIRNRRGRGQRDAEQSQLVAELPASGIGQIAGHVPPFVAKFRVWAVVGGKDERTRLIGPLVADAVIAAQGRADTEAIFRLGAGPEVRAGRRQNQHGGQNR